MAQAALGWPSMRLSESSDEVEEVEVTLSELPPGLLVESELPRMSPSPDSRGYAERSKDRGGNFAYHPSSPERPALPQFERPTCSKSRSRPRSPSQPGSRSRSGSRSSKQQAHRSLSQSSSSSKSGSNSSSSGSGGSSSSSSSDDSRLLQSSESEASAR